jgi:hypothetical protein
MENEYESDRVWWRGGRFTGRRSVTSQPHWSVRSDSSPGRVESPTPLRIIDLNREIWPVVWISWAFWSSFVCVMIYTPPLGGQQLEVREHIRGISQSRSDDHRNHGG